MKLTYLAIIAVSAFAAVRLHQMGEKAFVAIPIAISAILLCYALKQSRVG